MVKFISLLLSIPRASAQIIDNTVNLRDPTLSDVGLTILSVTRWTVGVLGGIAILMILYGAFQYVTAYVQGKDKMDAGKKTIMYSILGLIIAGVAYIGVTFVIASLTTDF